MKIDNVNINHVIGAYQSESVARAKADGDRPTDKMRTVGADRVELSTRKDEIEKLKKAADAIPEVRSERVAALKQQISEGTYRVDGVKVAEKMLESFKGSGGAGESK